MIDGTSDKQLYVGPSSLVSGSTTESEIQPPADYCWEGCCEGPESFISRLAHAARAIGSTLLRGLLMLAIGIGMVLPAFGWMLLCEGIADGERWGDCLGLLPAFVWVIFILGKFPGRLPWEKKPIGGGQ